MIKYRFISIAFEEAGDAAAYYDKESSGLGKVFLDEMNRKIDLLRSFPNLGKPSDKKVLISPLRKFPYNIIYYVHQQELVIISVAHQSRKPEYWIDRIIDY